MNVRQKNFKLRLFLWFLFAAVSLLTFLVRYTRLSYIGFEKLFYFGFHDLLVALGILCVITAAVILVVERFRLWPVLGVIFGLIMGQLWYMEYIVAFALWDIGRFAP